MTTAARTETNVLFSLLHAAHLLTDSLDEALGEAGLSAATFDVLSELVNAGKPVPPRELAARVGCTQSYIAKRLSELEADGLVRRLGGPGERRGERVVITSHGEARRRAGAARLDAAQQAVADVVASLDRVAVEHALATLRALPGPAQVSALASPRGA